MSIINVPVSPGEVGPGLGIIRITCASCPRCGFDLSIFVPFVEAGYHHDIATLWIEMRQSNLPNHCSEDIPFFGLFHIGEITRSPGVSLPDRRIVITRRNSRHKSRTNRIGLGLGVSIIIRKKFNRFVRPSESPNGLSIDVISRHGVEILRPLRFVSRPENIVSHEINLRKFLPHFL